MLNKKTFELVEKLRQEEWDKAALSLVAMKKELLQYESFLKGIKEKRLEGLNAMSMAQYHYVHAHLQNELVVKEEQQEHLNTLIEKVHTAQITFNSANTNKLLWKILGENNARKQLKIESRREQKDTDDFNALRFLSKRQ